SLEHGGLELHARRAAQLLGQGAANRVDDVHLAALERGQARGLVGDDLEDDAPDVRPLAPVLVERLHHDLDARREGDELVGAGAHRRFLETRSEEHTSELQSRFDLVCRLLLEKKKKKNKNNKTET